VKNMLCSSVPVVWLILSLCAQVLNSVVITATVQPAYFFFRDVTVRDETTRGI